MEKKTILLVDDELFIRELIKDCLEDTGHILKETKSIDEAKEILKESDVDLVILDWNLGRGNSKEIIDTINVKVDKIPVVIITGDHQLNLKNTYEKVIRDVIYKPFQIDEFIDKINKIWSTNEEK